MAPYVYEQVAPLVAGIQEAEGRVDVAFRCPLTGTVVHGSAARPNRSAVARAAGSAGGMVLGHVREGVARSVRRAITRGVLSGAAAQVAHQVVGKVYNVEAPGHGSHDAELRAAVVEAFASVGDAFTWDASVGGYVAREGSAGWASTAADAFTAQLRAHPVPPGDDAVLARLLAAVVAGDGDVGDHERAVLADLLPGHDIDALLAAGAPGPGELGGTQPGGSRETLLLLAWAVALTDQRLGEGERALLAHAASALGLAPAEAEAARTLAQLHVLEQARAAFEAAGWTGADLEAQVAAIAGAIGAA